jgi:sialic acid synthase SpsE
MSVDRVLIIAEIGECWNGDIARAETLISVAKDSGCDYAKFQTLDRNGIAMDDPERDWFLKIAMGRDQLEHLRRHATKVGIRFLATPEKAPQARVLYEMGCEEVKIGSSCLLDQELLSFVNGRFQTVFLSTGLAEIDEVQRAVAILKSVPHLYLLHCVAEYPTGPLLEERGLVALSDTNVQLSMIRILAELFPEAKVGYSDHTVGLLAPILAVAAGAQVIEKHITLDRETPIRNFRNGGPYLGTDHVLSLEPDELAEMTQSIRKVEEMLGPKRWQRTEGELKLRNFLRKRFSHDVKPGA